MPKKYNWRCKVCDMVNEAPLEQCAICAAPKILSPLDAEILYRSQNGLPQDEKMLREQALQEKIGKLHPVAEVFANIGVIGLFLGVVLFQFAMTVALHLWAIGILAVSWLIIKVAHVVDGALNTDGKVKDNRTEVLKENP